MKYFTVMYNGVNVGVFSQYQILNGFEDFEFKFLEVEVYKPCMIDKCIRYMYTQKLMYFMPSYLRIKKR